MRKLLSPENVRSQLSARAIWIAVSASLILVVLVILGLIFLSPRSQSGQTAAMAPTPSTTSTANGTSLPYAVIAPSSVDTITVYPGVTKVTYLTHTDDQQPWSIQGNFVTDATNPQILEYYDQRLAADGWTHDPAADTVVNGDSDSLRNYLWIDKTNTLPWEASLEVSLSPLYSQPTRVQVTLGRRPSLSRVPVYPNAQQLESHWESSSTIQGFGKTYFTYLTDASPDDVKAYYLSVLPQSGWLKSSDATDDIATGGIEYEWHTGVIADFQRDSYIAIKATTDSVHKTEVQVVLALQIQPGHDYVHP